MSRHTTDHMYRAAYKSFVKMHVLLAQWHIDFLKNEYSKLVYDCPPPSFIGLDIFEGGRDEKILLFMGAKPQGGLKFSGATSFSYFDIILH